MIFQDPISSLNPRRRSRDIVAEPLRDLAGQRRKRAGPSGSTRCWRRSASIPTQPIDRDPHEFSGGQCQRICIARALVLDPKLIICDEPVSALDVSVQAQILNLLEDMKVRYGLTMIFIAHDLAVVKNISDRVAVMYLGKICEVGRPDDALQRSRPTPTPSALLDVDPACPTRARAARARPALAGELPSPLEPAVGLPVPHPLPARPGRLRRGRAADAATRR